MFKVNRVDNCLEVFMSGTLDSEDMKVALDDLIAKSEGIEANGKMIFDVVDYHIPSLGAIAIELSRLFELLEWMKKFDKAAVLCDESWIKTIAEFKGKLFPHFEIKAFNRDERDKAKEWLDTK